VIRPLSTAFVSGGFTALVVHVETALFYRLSQIDGVFMINTHSVEFISLLELGYNV
jgi:hypothetical protein